MYLLLDIFLWLLVGASVIWAFAPPICSIMGFWRVRCTSRDDAQAVLPAGDDPDYESKFQQLSALGFRPVGVITEHYRLFAFHWYKAIDYRFLATDDGMVCAGIYRMLVEPASVRFDSIIDCGERGHNVRTVTLKGAEDGWETRDEYLTRVEKNLPIAKLYEYHQNLVAQISAEKGAPTTPCSIHDLANVDIKIEKTRYHALVMLPFLTFPAVFVLVPAVVILRVAYLLYWGEAAMMRATAVALCLGGLTYLFFLSVLFPMAVKSIIAKANASGNPAEEQPS